MEISENTPEKIESLPSDLQKLVWRALFYKSQVSIYEKEYSLKRDNKTLEKLNKYREAFKNVKRIFTNKCKSKGLKDITIADK
ncbi:hypothetical protein KAX35_10165 [candidate division WOR-3 bacterium]|nr:hypothetical protein [candidate division WOR-3 bacterium]